MSRMLMKALVATLALGTACPLPAIAQTAPMSVRFQGVTKPDAPLNAFLEEMRATLAKGDTAAINALFAPSVRVFQRDLDPFRAWKETEAVTEKPLESLSRTFFQEGELPGAPPVDYSGQLVSLLAEAFAPGAPLGKMPQVKDGLCSPPRYALDAAKIRHLAKKFDSLPVSVHVAQGAFMLKEAPTPEAKVSLTVTKGTALFPILETKTPEGWAHVALSDGRKGYTSEIEDSPTLHQRHVCLGKRGDRYRIIAVFAYGL